MKQYVYLSKDGAGKVFSLKEGVSTENIPFFVFTDNYNNSWTKRCREYAEERQRLALGVIRDYQLYLNPPPKPKTLTEIWEERGDIVPVLGLS
jgi:hypothetical protein